MTRREWLTRVTLLSAAWQLTQGAAMAQRSARDAVDHLLLGAPDLDSGIAWLATRTGVKAAVGGVHPGMGTRNALASLGGRQYLEIIAPDPAQTEFKFQIDLRKLAAPRLVTWAASTSDADGIADAARAAGFGVFGPRDGSRKRPDGSVLHWRTVGVDAGFATADLDPTPFFIQWSADSKHPATDSPSGLRLTAFELRHPEPAKLESALSKLGIDASVQESGSAVLQATLDTPKGRVVLGSAS
jgi:hypothetical protein